MYSGLELKENNQEMPHRGRREESSAVEVGKKERDTIIIRKCFISNLQAD